MAESQDGQITPFGLKYQLEVELRLFNPDNVRGLPRNQTGVYAL